MKQIRSIEYTTCSLRFKPVVTLNNNTQLAKNHDIRLPLREHYKSRFPQLNRNLLHERYRTDTMFSIITSVGEKYTCCQLFIGQETYYSKAMGMTTESSGCEALEYSL